MFEPKKNADELGIDKTRKFRVCRDGGGYFKGDILELRNDDGTRCSLFLNLTAEREGRKHPTEDKWKCCAYWSDLEYADEETKTPQQFKHIFLCPTKQDWIDICQWLEDNTDLRWWGSGRNLTEFENWDAYEEKTAIRVDGDINYFDEEYYRKNYPGHKFITVKEFLDEKRTNINIVSIDLGEMNDKDVWVTREYQWHFNSNKLNKPNKSIMNTIKNAFKSKEDKAMEYFGLGTSKDLNEAGRQEFIDFVYETGTTDKKDFLKKIVEAYKEEKK